jgi:transcriptional regulator with XRE-family HTH domain
MTTHGTLGLLPRKLAIRQDACMTANPGEPQTSAPPTPRGRIPSDTLSNRLVLARRLAGMTIDQAAAAAGVKSSSWANWEAGRRPQRETDVIGAIADALDIDFNWLLLGGPLLGPRGKPTERPGGTTRRYYPSPLVQPAPTVRPGKTGPKTRRDPQRPISPVAPGRRAVRVNPVSVTDSLHAA